VLVRVAVIVSLVTALAACGGDDANSAPHAPDTGVHPSSTVQVDDGD
jgi:hypothetical protein